MLQSPWASIQTAATSCPRRWQAGHDPQAGQTAAREDQREAPERAGPLHPPGDPAGDRGDRRELRRAGGSGDLDDLDLPARLAQPFGEAVLQQAARAAGRRGVPALDVVGDDQDLDALPFMEALLV